MGPRMAFPETLAINTDEFLNTLNDWLPLFSIVFIVLLLYVMFRMLAVMPKTKPQEIKASQRSGVALGRHRRRRGHQGRAPRGRRVPLRPEAVQEPGREGPEGDPPPRSARHRQDDAREGRGARVGRELLQPVGLVIRRDVRRTRRGTDPPPVQGGARSRPGDPLHRRARRRRHDPRQRHLRRTRPDAQPTARRDGRLRVEREHRRDGRFEPAREARSGPAAPGPLRPPGLRPAAATCGAARRSSASTPAASRSVRTSTCTGSPSTHRA